MKPLTKLSLKILLYSFVVINLQIALVSDFMGFSLNLAFASVIVFASLLSLFEASLVALFFMLFISIYSYDSQILWIYPVIAFLGVKLNPASIDDKFLVCIVYALIFTPVIELFSYSGQDFLSRILNASLSNVIASIIIFFIVKMLFKAPKHSRYPSLK